MTWRKSRIIDENKLRPSSSILPMALQFLRHPFLIIGVTSGVEPDRWSGCAFRRAGEHCFLFVHPLLNVLSRESVGYADPAANKVNYTFDEFRPFAGKHQREKPTARDTGDDYFGLAGNKAAQNELVNYLEPWLLCAQPIAGR